MAPVSREIAASISDKVSGNGYEMRGASGGWVDGAFSDGFDRVSAGTFSEDVARVAAVVLSLGAVSPFPAGAAGCGDDGASTLPRMIGKPSLPLPTITILELEDCAS